MNMPPSNGYHHHADPVQNGGHVIPKLRRGGRGRRSSEARVSERNPSSLPTPCTDFDVAYFQSYAHVGIHEEMIKDRVRTETYRAAIMQHQNCIAGKVVVDVGCGTGILSIFCAQAGAKRIISGHECILGITFRYSPNDLDANVFLTEAVIDAKAYTDLKIADLEEVNGYGVYAVDASDIAVQANEVVKANNLADKVIVLHGRVEDVEIDEQVDVIVSEWMGYMLLYESMLGSVITARDRWLKPGGLILPSYATLYLAPVTHPDRYGGSIDFWRNVYGIDMSAMLPLAKQCAFEEPSVETISGENVLTWPHVVKHVDCYTVTRHELESVTTSFIFKSMMRAPFHGFAFWFDVDFSFPGIAPSDSNGSSVFESLNDHPNDVTRRKKRGNPNETLVLSTAPEDPPTHWQQTLIYFYEPIEVEQDQLIEGCLALTQSKENRRFMNIHLEYACGGRSFVKESVMR